jgi:lysophospholipase L1-like esterase
MTRLRRFPRLLAHALLFAACLELAARVDDWITYGAPPWAPYDAEVLRTVDANGLRRNRPGARFEKWRINALGFRGEEISSVKAPGRRRIVCLGHSESFGLYESEGAEWPAQLERLLRASRRNVEVINASVVGQGRKTQLAYLTRYVIPLRPDVIVLYPSVLLDLFDAVESPRPAAVPRLPAAMLPRSRALPKVTERLRLLLPQVVADPLRWWLVEGRVRRLEAGLRRQPPLESLPDAEVRAFESHLREVIHLLKLKTIAPALATYPTLGDESNLEKYRLLVARQRTWNIRLSERGLVEAALTLNDVIRRVAAEEGVALANVEPAVPRDLRYFADYVHYTDAGAEAVAKCVADALIRAHLLDGEAAP